MTRRHTRPLTRLYLRRNLARVMAVTPNVPDDAQTPSHHSGRRRRPATGQEAQRRKDFGRIYGAANSEAGKRVREERK